jgi:hypothetical protein
MLHPWSGLNCAYLAEFCGTTREKFEKKPCPRLYFEAANKTDWLIK